MEIIKTTHPQRKQLGIEYILQKDGHDFEVYSERELRTKYCGKVYITLEGLKEPFKIESCEKTCKQMCSKVISLLPKKGY